MGNKPDYFREGEDEDIGEYGIDKKTSEDIRESFRQEDQISKKDEHVPQKQSDLVVVLGLTNGKNILQKVTERVNGLRLTRRHGDFSDYNPKNSDEAMNYLLEVIKDRF